MKVDIILNNIHKSIVVEQIKQMYMNLNMIIFSSDHCICFNLVRVREEARYMMDDEDRTS